MIEAIAGLFMAALAGIAYIFKTQRDAALRDAEDNLKQVQSAKARANENEKRAKVLVEAIKNRQNVDEKADEIVKRPERDFFESNGLDE